MLDPSYMLTLQIHFAYGRLESARETDELEACEIAMASPCSVEMAFTSILLHSAQ